MSKRQEEVKDKDVEECMKKIKTFYKSGHCEDIDV